MAIQIATTTGGRLAPTGTFYLTQNPQGQLYRDHNKMQSVVEPILEGDQPITEITMLRGVVTGLLC